MNRFSRPILFWNSLVFLTLLAGCKPEQRPQENAPATAAANGPSAPALQDPGQLLGKFTAKSGELVVSDPCYPAPQQDKTASGNDVLTNVKRGEWNAYLRKIDAGEFGLRCAELTVLHAEQPAAAADKWVATKFIVGVDSGQAGIFERQSYDMDALVPPDCFKNEEPIDPDKPWYSMCCKLTLSDLGAGVIPGGAVSRSGYGDGGYECFYRTNAAGEVTGVRILFLDEKRARERGEQLFGKPGSQEPGGDSSANPFD